MHYGMAKHAFAIDEMFAGLDDKLLRGRWVKNRYKDPKLLAIKIFKDCFYDILLDIINNNVTFVLPLKFGDYAEIYMKQYTDDKFKKLYKFGAFNNIDYVLSQFTGNRLNFKYSTRTVGTKEKSIYVSNNLNKLIKDYTHEAKQYY